MHTRASEGHPEREPSVQDRRLRHLSSQVVSRAAPGSPLAVLAEGEDLRERTSDAIARVVAASAADVPGDTRTRKLLRRTEAARKELSQAEFALAEAWRTGDRQAKPLRAVARLRSGVEEQRASLLETPDGLLAAKEADLARYADELHRTRFALTPSRDTAVDALLEAVVQGRPVLMLGPSGTGKTTVVKELARRLGVDDPEIIPGNEVTSGQLWGTRGLDPQKGDVIRDGIVARAMVGGKLLLWDEANASEEAMEKFLKFKAYLTTRPGDMVRVPPEHPDLRPVSPKFAFLLTGNPKGEKHKTRAEFPPEVARELGEVTLDYLPEDELYDVCLAALSDDGMIPLAKDELRSDGPLHALVRLVAEVQRLYLGRSEARGTATTATLRRLVIDPGMVTAWLQAWSFARSRKGESLASYLDRQLLALARSEKYPAEDRAILAQTANRFRFLATSDAKRALTVPGLNGAALTGSPFPKGLYAPDRSGETTFAEAAASHPYLQKQLDERLEQLLKTVAQRGGMDEEKVRSLLLGTDTKERISELRALVALEPATLRERLGQPAERPPRGPRSPRGSTEKPREGQLSLRDLNERLQVDGLRQKLEGGNVTEQVRKYAAAFADGALGFTLDESALTFPDDKIPELERALLSGTVDGVVVAAYPTREQVDAIARSTGEEVERLLDLPVAEYWIRHFEGRGGTIADRDNRLATWRTLRWSPDGSLALPSAHATLPEQPRLRDVLGRAQLSFASTACDVAATTPILQSVPPGDPKHITAQGDGLTFAKLHAAGASILAPDEWLAMVAASNPKDIATYPSPNTWDWLSGVTPSCAARGGSGSGGLGLNWRVPEVSYSSSRARSVVRGTPGFQGLDSALDLDASTDEGLDTRLDVPGTWGVDQLRKWLTNEALEAKLEGGSLEHWISKAEAAYADGTLGFSLDRSSIRFEVTAEKLARLKAGIEAGSITGAVVEAYPTDSDLTRSVGKLGLSSGDVVKRLKKLREMPVTEFLAEHFTSRGGTLYEKADRIKEWRKLRWATDGGETLRQRVVRESQVKSLDPKTWGTLVREFTELLPKVYKALPTQPTLADRAGSATLVFADVRTDVPQATKLLASDGTASTHPQGDGLSFIRLLQDDVPTASPTEFLALATALSDPKTISTYPSPKTWEWFEAITPSSAASGRSASDGLSLRWNDPGNSRSVSRARSVVR